MHYSTFNKQKKIYLKVNIKISNIKNINKYFKYIPNTKIRLTKNSLQNKNLYIMAFVLLINFNFKNNNWKSKLIFANVIGVEF